MWIPLSFAIWFFNFYSNEYKWSEKILNKLTRKQKLFYWVS
ncbi:MAG: hypothetical protein ACD_49C00064G0031 [uncultured bacterium (gcode 4)]|uniref:Uncharacterized protein n=1 Tax=uncultured bacterium (gcode 4) TaxID=1234023 RepID=K2BBK0_9BACT|nr:MAG: hypothetical protein ACD_49C00064G0031 [uncultured bacterium (gcode 4)]